MSNSAIKSALGIVLVLSAATAVGEREHRRTEEEKKMLIRRVEAIKVKIEQLRLEALDHEAQAKALQAEAARLELQLRREIEEHKVGFEMAEAQAKIHQMLAEAEHLEEQGHAAEADKLRATAEDLAAKMHAHMGKRQEKVFEEMDREIAKLREQSKRAEEEGRLDESRRLWKEADQLAEELERQIRAVEQPEPIDKMHGRMRELARAIEEADRKGRGREADKLREEARELERQMHGLERSMETERLAREVDQLHAAAAEAEDRGDMDKANAIRHEVKQLERRRAERIAEQDHREGEGAGASAAMWKEIEGLHKEIAGLREVVEHLRRELSSK